jgi:hypothetical protein
LLPPAEAALRLGRFSARIEVAPFQKMSEQNLLGRAPEEPIEFAHGLQRVL